MNQLAFNQPNAFEPNAFSSSAAPAAGQGHFYNEQAFSYPGQYYDGVNLPPHQWSNAGGQSAAPGMPLQKAYSAASQPTLDQPTSTPSVPARVPFATPPIARNARQTASPPQHLALDHAGNHTKSHSITLPANQTPMAATPQSHSPAIPQQQSQQQQQQPHNTSLPTTPHSPTTQTAPNTREQTRIALILSINQELILEINRLQNLSQGGAVNPSQAAQLRTAGQSDKMASEAYIQLLRRLQGNLAYLMPKAGNNPDGNPSKVLPGPVFMQHPPQMPQLREKYEKLRDLFPDWAGNDAKLMAMSGSSGGGMVGGAGQQGQQQSVNGVMSSTS